MVDWRVHTVYHSGPAPWLFSTAISYLAIIQDLNKNNSRDLVTSEKSSKWVITNVLKGSQVKSAFRICFLKIALISVISKENTRRILSQVWQSHSIPPNLLISCCEVCAIVRSPIKSQSIPFFFLSQRNNFFLILLYTVPCFLT